MSRQAAKFSRLNELSSINRPMRNDRHGEGDQ
jgi:hypothetical protein